MTEDKIGFMQGRLSPMVGGKIQAFPWDHWAYEFPASKEIGIQLMEWTLDQDRLYENPLMTVEGQKQIKDLSEKYRVKIHSLTGDCFMQAPFWKNRADSAELKRDFCAVVKACGTLNIQYIVVPLVDNGRLDHEGERDCLVNFLLENVKLFASQKVTIVFESDFKPLPLRDFIELLPPAIFGINYDIGNSAALGYNPIEEIESYGPRIYNVHVKDRLLGGTTVPLGSGNAKFGEVFSALKKCGYSGNYILQTARAQCGDHAVVLKKYHDMVLQWLDQYGL